MTLATDLLDRLAEVGAEVEASGGRFIVRAGAKPVPGELIQRLRKAKTEILAALIPETCVGRRLTAPHADPAAWREEYNCRSFHWSLDGQRPWQEARQIAFGFPTGISQRLTRDTGGEGPEASAMDWLADFVATVPAKDRYLGDWL